MKRFSDSLQPQFKIMLRIEFNHGGVGISGIIGGFLEFSNILHDMIYVYHVITFDIYSLQTRFQIPNVLIHSPITCA